MNRILSLALVIGISVFGVAAGQAMPLAPLDQAQTGITIPVAGGCGAGWHRGPGGACRPNGYYGGVYYGGAPVVVAPGAVVVAPGAPCGGRGTHRVCNPYRCWRVCN
ncbi:MAG TPA: hypothetical protein VEJ43_11455 [Pseudolabrys sp.]|nr:hypothetical protein [Pseudolabrys sp.]